MRAENSSLLILFRQSKRSLYATEECCAPSGVRTGKCKSTGYRSAYTLLTYNSPTGRNHHHGAFQSATYSLLYSPCLLFRGCICWLWPLCCRVHLQSFIAYCGFSQPLSPPATLLISQSGSQSVRQPVPKWVSRLVNQPLSQFFTKTASQKLRLPISQSVSQSTSQPSI